MGFISSRLQIIEGENSILLYNSWNGQKIKCSKSVKDAIDIIRTENYTKDKMEADFPELYAMLNKMGLIADSIEEKTYNYNIEEIRKGKLVNALRLNISECCNLNCSYCYEKVTNQSRIRRNMSLDVAVRAINLFKEIIIANKKPRCTFRFFGGEPLINFELLKKSIEHIESVFPDYIEKEYLLNTNGTLIDESIAQFLKDHHFIIILSVDGIREQHDGNRKFADGRGSFERVDKSIDLLADKGCTVALTTVMTDNNYAHLTELVDYICKKKKKYDFECKLSLNNVHICSKAGLVELNVDDQIRYFVDAVRYAKKIGIDLSGGNTFLIFNNMMFGNNGRHCGANGFELSVDPVGDVFCCGGTQMSYGNISEGQELLSKAEYLFMATRNPEKVEKCRECPIACYCGAGCYLEYMSSDGKEEKTQRDCEQERRIFIELVKEFIL